MLMAMKQILDEMHSHKYALQNALDGCDHRQRPPARSEATGTSCFEVSALLGYMARNRSASCRIPFTASPNAKRIEVDFREPGSKPCLGLAAMIMVTLAMDQPRIQVRMARAITRFRSTCLSDLAGNPIARESVGAMLRIILGGIGGSSLQSQDGYH